MRDSTRAELRPPAAVASASSAELQASPPPSDHAVYAAVLREHFMQPRRGEHGLLCESDEPRRRLAIVGTTQPLPPGTPTRDAGWANELPEPAAPLMAALRALDREPRRAIDGDGLAVGIPIQLVPDSVAARPLQTTDHRAARAGSRAPPLFWFSRVAYTADRRWALVHAVEVCPGATEADAAEAENGAYETVLLAPLEWRAGVWTVHPAVFLDVGLPRLVSR